MSDALAKSHRQTHIPKMLREGFQAGTKTSYDYTHCTVAIITGNRKHSERVIGKTSISLTNIKTIARLLIGNLQQICHCFQAVIHKNVSLYASTHVNKLYVNIIFPRFLL